MLRLVGIGTDGDKLAAKLTVTAQNLFGRIWMTKSVFKASGIDFNALAKENELS